MKAILSFVFSFVFAIAFSQNYEIYVSDAGNFNNPPWQILKFDGNGQNPVTFINTNLNWPQDILFMEDSNTVLISNLGSNRISKFNATSGAYIGDFATGISGPTRMKVGSDGLLYVLQWSGNGKVKRYEMNGTFVDDFTSVGVVQSIGMDWDASGNLYVSSYSGDLVRKFDSNGMDMGVFVNTNLLGPTNIWFDNIGDLLVADYNGTAVKRYNSSGIYQSDFITGLSACEGVDFLPNGNILIGNGGTSSVKLYDNNGNYIQDIIASGAGNLLTPNAVRIRNIVGLSVSEHESGKRNVIYPTVGYDFYITQLEHSKLESLELFDIKGKHCAKIQPDNSGRFLLNYVPQGMYVVKIQSKNRSVRFEKIVVLY